MTLDRVVARISRCDDCDALILAGSPNEAGYVICPECQHPHPSTRRAFLAEAKKTAAAAKSPFPGTADDLNGLGRGK